MWTFILNSTFIATMLTITTVSCASNCGVGSAACDKCGSNSTVLQVDTPWGPDLLKVCCKDTCSTYYRAGYGDPTNKRAPFCSCTFETVGGDCWKGDICKTCGHSQGTGSINGVPVCCKNCARGRGISLSGTNCECIL